MTTKHNNKKRKNKKLSKDFYESELLRLQTELVALQNWIKNSGSRVVVIFEGRDASGKGGVIKRITQCLNPRIVKTVALPAPSDREKSQWYFQRYVQHLPAAGEMVLFDRSWYNRAGVERVMGFCTKKEYREFLRSCPEFEHMLIRSGIKLIKYWFSVSDTEQEKRFKSRIHSPLKRWKFSLVDMESRAKWVDYSKAKDAMFCYTDTSFSPWWVVEGDNKKNARLNCISHLLDQFDYEPLELTEIELPAINHSGYVRAPIHKNNFVPERY